MISFTIYLIYFNLFFSTVLPTIKLYLCLFDVCLSSIELMQNNGAQQLASEATVYIMLEDVNDEIPLFTEREQETVLEGEPIGTKVTQVNAIDKDGTFPNNQVCIICNM